MSEKEKSAACEGKGPAPFRTGGTEREAYPHGTFQMEYEEEKEKDTALNVAYAQREVIENMGSLEEKKE